MEHEQLDLQRAQAPLRNKRNSLISPIYTLPSELLADIFKTAVETVSPDDSSDKHTRKTVSHVCSRWRQIALEVCPVWHAVCLTFKTNYASEDKLKRTELELHGILDWKTQVPVDRPTRASDAQYT